MQIPLRLVLLVRPSVAPGVLLAVGFSTMAVVATPFLIQPVADHYDIGLTRASLIGVAQLAGFVAGSWGSGRFLRPRRRVFVAALGLAVVANLTSALLPPFAVLIALRLLSGFTLGLLSWFGWVQVFGEEKGTADVAVVGPVAGILTGPLLAVFAGGGASTLFALLGCLAVVPLLFNAGTGAADRVAPRRPRSRPVPAAALILVALGLYTVGGSSVFTYVVVLAAGEPGLPVSTVALLFSANSIAAIPATRWPWRRGWPAPWMLATGGAAVVLTNATHPVLFAASVVIGGFFFWMAVPGVFAALAARSANPADRAGDAQAIMAAGRVVGPFIGGLMFDAAGATALGLTGAAIIAGAASVVFVVRSMVEPAES
ncbi:MAG: YbfB/YjiJ family MFS transporter [Actinomycetota bacterium]